ncbi:MAG: ferredoxin [Deltaproteobacteria bacterium]|nr:ferredoxin [Deltaproteobacteria bacterium]RLB29227.1 MAG: ferredoxin [Deltaproteobacteria bacterium]
MRPVIDYLRCTDCESCLSLFPHIFHRNEDTGLIEVMDLPEYALEEVGQAISMCPADCIEWQKT